MTDFKMVPLTDIKPDPNQPRKYYDETAMQELTDSVREKGILQPILIRPKEKGFLIVCGERRYKAAISVQALFKQRNEIPALIRELTDEDALELQIIENLQRKDVHPMEEAVAFKSLVEKGKDIKEIAARVGKSEFYARQRLKLNSLTKGWQELFYAGRLGVTDALKLALFDEKIQQALHKDYSRTTGHISLNTWELNKYRGDLSAAPFDLNDATINKKMGACTGCQFNSASASLFADSAKSPTCLNISCFKEKCDNNFAKQFEAALEDTTIIFVHDSYGTYNDKFTAKVEKRGLSVIGTNGYATEDPPARISWEEFYEDNSDDYNSEAEVMKAFEKEEKEYEKELADYQEKIAGGKFKKAFMLTGSDRGKFIFIRLTGNSSKGSSAKTKQKEAENKLTVSDIDDEIKRIRERHARSKEIDTNNIHRSILEQLSKKKAAVISMKCQPSIDRGIMVYLLIEHRLQYGRSNSIEKYVKGLPSDKNKGVGYAIDYFKALSKVTDDQLAAIVRSIVFEEWGNPAIIRDVDTNDTPLRLIAEYAGIDIQSIEQAQNEKFTAREERVKKKIESLQDKKSELKGAKK